MLTTYARVMAAWRARMFEDRTQEDRQRWRAVNALPHEEYRAMLDAREICGCGHPRSDHDHQVADCYRCDACAMFTDQNDLVDELRASEEA